jgi:hypothetical protein
VGGSNAGDWKAFESEDGEFSLLMPTAPKENTSNTNAGDIPLTLYNFVSTQGDSEYTIVYVDYPADAVAAVGDPRQVLKNAFGGVHGDNAVESEEETTVQGHPSLLAEFDSSSGYAWYQSILRDNRLYQLIAISPDKASGDADARRFLESFKITGEGSSDGDGDSDGDNNTSSQGEMSGMTGLQNTVRFTINDIRHDDGQAAVLKPEAGNEYVHLDITITNTGSDEESISTFFANIVDSTGAEHDATYGPHVEDALNLAVPAGGEAKGSMAFEVPADATGLVFVYDPPLDDNTLRIKLDK